MDEFGGTAGIVTLEDILEQIVGEIQDERDVDEVAPIQIVAEDQLRVEGGVALSELEAVLGHGFDREDVSTVGGPMLAEFGRVPRAGEAIDLDGYRLVVEQVIRRRVRRSRSSGPRSKRRSRAPSGCSHDLAGHPGGTGRRGVRRHGRRGAHHREPHRAHPRGESPAPGRHTLPRLAGTVDNYLTAASATTSLGVLLVGAALPGLVTGSGAPRAVVVLAVIGVPLVLFAAYLVPRWLTHPRAETVADRVIPLLRPWSRVLGLLLPARTATRPTDLRSIWREGAAVGLRADDELFLVGGVMAFSVRPVREVMTPRTDIVAIGEDAALDEIRAVFAQSGYSRIPVFRETLDDIIGMLHAFDLFKLRPGDPLPVRPVALTPASRSCGDLLLDMQRERRHLAVVLDEFGGTLGIATLEDLLEELVGEIYDEHDEEVRSAPAAVPSCSRPTATSRRRPSRSGLACRCPSGPLNHRGRAGGRVGGRIPGAGERFTIRGLEFDVLQASPTRIERLVIRSGANAPVTLLPGSA